MGRGSYGDGGNTEAVVKAGSKGHGRTRELRQAVNLISEISRNDETAVDFFFFFKS